MNPVAPLTKIRIFPPNAAANSVVRDEALTRFASHKEALAVRVRHSGDEAGRSSGVSNSRSHCFAESSASSDPNNSLTAPKQAANSRPALLIDLAQSGFLGCLGIAN